MDKLNSINTKPSVMDLQQLISPESAQQDQGKDLFAEFGNVLNESLQKVSQTKQASQELTQKYTLGEDVPLHQVMITAEKASNAMEITMKVRNKILQAYQEVMHMPI
jgi:flagellar hook-basal body complex protein FliE